MTSPDPINDLEPLDSQIFDDFDDKVVKKLRIMGSPRRKMGNISTMYNRTKAETIPEITSEGDEELEKL